MITDRAILENSTRYHILTKWLKERLENNETIDSKELKKLLSSLEIVIREKVQDIKVGE